MASPSACSTSSSVSTGSSDRANPPRPTTGAPRPVAVALRLGETRRALARSCSVRDPAPHRRSHPARQAALDALESLCADAHSERPAAAANDVRRSASEWHPGPAWDMVPKAEMRSSSISSLGSESSLHERRRVGDAGTVVRYEKTSRTETRAANGKSAAPWFESPEKRPGVAGDVVKDSREEPGLFSRMGESVQRGLKGASFHTGILGGSESRAAESRLEKTMAAERKGSLRTVLRAKRKPGERHSFRRMSLGHQNVNGKHPSGLNEARSNSLKHEAGNDERSNGRGAGWFNRKWEAKEREPVRPKRTSWMQFSRKKHSARQEISERYL